MRLENAKVKIRGIDPIRFKATKVIAEDLLTMTLDTGWAADELYVTLHAQICSETAGTYQHHSPATKWDMFKSAVFPNWLIKIFPVRYKITTVTFKALFPEYVPPKERLGQMIQFYEVDSL